MHKKLLIVESPAKAKTINKYLGDEFKVVASFGHVRDLPKKNGSIDIANNFAPKYQIIQRNKKHIDEIIALSKDSEQIFLATDPDREGEAIAWHIAEILKSNKKIAGKKIERVTFNEITETAIKHAINNCRELDLNLIDAQQSRMTLDYLIGFNISPLLWRKIKPGISAGRVQSPALRLICERESEIKAFVPEDYFSVWLFTHKQAHKLQAKLIEYDKNKIDTKTIQQKAEAQDICSKLSKFSQAIVSNINKKQKKKNPHPPFITSSLQIEASRKLGFNTDKTMKVAQTLYEGIDLGHDTIGLISYMRTDSVNLSDTALTEIRDYIGENYPAKYLPNAPVKFITKVRNAQEAHEAIRPTSIARTPAQLKNHLSADQYKLYELIWLRTLACQFTPAILDTTAIDLSVDNGIFRVNGVIVSFDGFMHVYQEENEESNHSSDNSNSSNNANGGNDSSENDKNNKDNNKANKLNNATGENNSENIKLPNLEVGDELPIDKIDLSEHQTEPKPRYSEASLVKTLEELGIGRPSTYASIISTLKKREYVLMDKKRFIPTDIGMVVSTFLTNHLTKYVDYQFTANLEDTLDDISNGKTQKIPVLENFWHDLEATILDKQNIARSELTSEKLDENCPKCGKQLISRFGKYGRFIGCSGYPDCNYMRKPESADGEAHEVVTPEIIEGRTCPNDGGQLVMRTGRYGKFISCNNYPKCKYIENLDKPDEGAEEVLCPECKTGHIVSKKNRYGNWFYACNNYPKCKTLFNHKPLAEKCPKCGYELLMHKKTKTKGEEKVCPKCDFAEKITEKSE